MNKGIGTIALAGALMVAFNNPLWTDEAGATKALKDQGYAPTQVGGYDLFGCDTVYATKFTAKINDREVNGVVCKGLINRTSSVHTL